MSGSETFTMELQRLVAALFHSDFYHWGSTSEKFSLNRKTISTQPHTVTAHVPQRAIFRLVFLILRLSALCAVCALLREHSLTSTYNTVPYMNAIGPYIQQNLEYQQSCCGFFSIAVPELSHRVAGNNTHRWFCSVSHVSEYRSCWTGGCVNSQNQMITFVRTGIGPIAHIGVIVQGCVQKTGTE